MRRKRGKNGTGFGIIALVVCIFAAIVSYGRIGLQDRYDQAQIKMKRLQGQVDEQKERALDISNLKAYVQTKAYIEEVAREKLGLVYPDEIIFTPEEDQ